jgi:hypothetical protein
VIRDIDYRAAIRRSPRIYHAITIALSHRFLISEVKMTTSQPLPLAVASLKSAISWT